MNNIYWLYIIIIYQLLWEINNYILVFTLKKLTIIIKYNVKLYHMIIFNVLIEEIQLLLLMAHWKKLF